MARSYVARELVRLGGQPAWRMGFTTDNGNVILDVSGLVIEDPVALETTINQIAGVVTVGPVRAPRRRRDPDGHRDGRADAHAFGSVGAPSPRPSPASGRGRIGAAPTSGPTLQAGRDPWWVPVWC